MSNLLNVEGIEARRPYSESNITRFDPEHNPTPFYVPEQRQPDMFTHNPHLEVSVTAKEATELAMPAGDMFAIPQSPEQIAAEQEAYATAITAEHTNNVESLDARRYANAEAALHEAQNAGEAVMAVRNAA